MSNSGRTAAIEIFTERLGKLRKKHGHSMKKVADLTGLNISTVWRIYKGERLPTVYIAVRLADLFETSFDYLFGRTNEENSPQLLKDCRTFSRDFANLPQHDRDIILAQIVVHTAKNAQANPS